MKWLMARDDSGKRVLINMDHVIAVYECPEYPEAASHAILSGMAHDAVDDHAHVTHRLDKILEMIRELAEAEGGR